MEHLRVSVFLVLAPVLGVVAYQRWRATALPVGLTLPPGPTPLPILGNALAVDRNTPWLTYTAWAEQYGPLVYLRLLGRDVIVINSEELVQELVERRSVYNDRPHYVTNDFFGIGFNSGFLHYGEAWRFHRRMLHQTFRAAAIPDKMHPMLRQKQQRLVKAIVDSPDECRGHLRGHAAAVIMAAVYGYETQPKNDRILHVVDRMLSFSTSAMTPEREALASTFPILKYIPTWMPGSRFRRDAIQCRYYCKEMLEAPFEHTVNAMASGDAPSSMTADLLSYFAGRGDYDMIREAVKGCASTALGGGFGTTDAAFMCFVLSMVLYPDAQRRAMAEIDEVVAMDRLPDFEDRSSLPYVEAVLREVWRWRPITPLGVPHATTQPDVYRGYYIPKGTMVLLNIWAITRSEKYHNPEAFIPERFLSESGTPTKDEVLCTFGAGRRKCVGRYFADASVWLTLVTLLSCFEFSKVGEWSLEDVKWTSGVSV
ncbi:cytochrome P450 [Boletus coccyginus]|nr:cytochrome P450 [Boletus coccyginus]